MSPPHQTVLFRAKPSLRRAYFFCILYAALVCVGRYRTDLDPSYNPVWWFFFSVFVVLMLYIHWKRWTTSYVITHEDIRVVEGIIARRAAIVPYRRVTNMSMYQSLSARLFGLVDVYIDTAGGDLAEVAFHRITKSDANRAAVILQQIIDGHTPTSPL